MVSGSGVGAAGGDHFDAENTGQSWRGFCAAAMPAKCAGEGGRLWSGWLICPCCFVIRRYLVNSC